jgi:hypothetical protein
MAWRLQHSACLGLTAVLSLSACERSTEPAQPATSLPGLSRIFSDCLPHRGKPVKSTPSYEPYQDLMALSASGTHPRVSGALAGLGGATDIFGVQLAATGTTGTLVIATATSGSNLDDDGYFVTLDGGEARAIGVNASLPVSDLPAGVHTVGLAGLAPNCAVSGDATRTGTVVAGGSTEVAFAVICSATTGTLRVVTSTSGSDIDGDGYQFSVDGGPAQTIGVNATRNLAGIAVGEHAVALSRVAANCTVAGTSTVSVNVPSGDVGQAAFSVTCVPLAQGPPDIVVEPAALAVYDFGNIAKKTSSDLSLTLRNQGGGLLEGDVSVLPGTAPFALLTGNAFQLANGAPHPLTLRFAPSTPGAYRALLRIHSNDPLNAEIFSTLAGEQFTKCSRFSRTIEAFRQYQPCGLLDRLRLDSYFRIPRVDDGTHLYIPDAELYDFITNHQAEVTAWAAQVEYGREVHALMFLGGCINSEAKYTTSLQPRPSWPTSCSACSISSAGTCRAR